MYTFLLKVSAARPKYVISDELADILDSCCKEANTKPNSLRKGYKFTYIDRVDEYTVSIRLESKTPVIATRAISSITRVLITKVSTDELLYNRNILKAIIAEESQDEYDTMDNTKVAQTVVEILFGQSTLGKNNRALAQTAADQIREICIKYKKESSRRY